MIITDNVSLLVFIAVGFVIPFLVDLVTKKLASGALKQTVFLALSLVSGVLIEFTKANQIGGSFDWVTAAYGAVFTFITGVATYMGLNRTPLLGSDSIISNAVPGGLGATQKPEIAVVEVEPLPAPVVLLEDDEEPNIERGTN